LPPHFS
jgi:perosamine synthetase